jgi:hypothetical protein
MYSVNYNVCLEYIFFPGLWQQKLTKYNLSVPPPSPLRQKGVEMPKGVYIKGDEKISTY